MTESDYIILNNIIYEKKHRISSQLILDAQAKKITKYSTLSSHMHVKLVMNRYFKQ